MLTVQEHEVDAQLTSLLDRAQRGEEVWIMRRGEPVARLVPPAERRRPNVTGEDTVARFRELRKGMSLGGLTWKELRGGRS
jgi:prevent-host-death family protein